MRRVGGARRLPRGVAAARQLRAVAEKELVERLEPAEVELGENAGTTPVARDHLARFVAGSIRHPRLGAPARERQWHERRAQVWDTDRDALRRPLEELRTRHTREGEIVAEGLRQLLAVEASAVLVEEDPAIRARLGVLLPIFLERADDVVAELPVARIVRLVLVEREDVFREVDVAPLKDDRFAVPAARTIEKAVQHSSLERDRGAPHHRGVLVGVQRRLRLLRPDGRKEAVGKRISLDDLARVDR